MNKKDELHPQDRRNLIIFIIASLLLWYVYDTYLLKPKLEDMRAAQVASQQAAADVAVGADGLPLAPRDRDTVLAESARLTIDNGAVFGSLALKGGRIDDLRLRDYFTTLEKTTPVTLLSPAGTERAKYIEHGWIAASETTSVPNRDSVWRVVSGNTLAANETVTLAWENGQGLRFERDLSIDDKYMLTVTQRVINNGAQSVTLHPYALISQVNLPPDFEGQAMIKEGLVSYVDGELTERPYRKWKDKNPQEEFRGETGWIGISDKYWLASLIPAQDGAKTYRFTYTPPATKDGDRKFQIDVMGAGVEIAPGAQVEDTSHAFSGAKEVKLLERYEEGVPVRHFDLAVNFGLWYFLTKPFFYILHFFGELVGNFGVAILCLTVVVRLAVFPLANISFRSFAKMKKIAPQMKELRDRYGDNREALQKELVALYGREKVNPMAGCLPLIIQIPIFFALYKVLLITIEMRHAPFFGWINDLSAMDPLTIFNLFGLIPWDPPSFLMIGPWSILMLLAMLVQKAMNPPPQDPTQAMMINIMPFFITFILAKFPAGLVIYWTFSNILSVAQQYVIMRSLGVEVHLFKRSKEDKEMEKMVLEGPNVHPGLEKLEEDVEDALFGHEDGSGDNAAPVTRGKPKKKKKKK